ISWHSPLKKFAEQSPDRTVGIDQYERPASQEQEAPNRAGVPDEMLEASAIDELRAGDMLEKPRTKHEGVTALRRFAAQTHAIEFCMIIEHACLETFEID